MIKSKTVKLKINNRNKKYYSELGYEIFKGEETEIKVKDLTKGSKVMINAICDICGKEKSITYHEYNKNTQKYNIFACDNKCAWVKNKKTNQSKYGKDSYSQTDEYNESVKKTNLEKYDEEYYTQTDEYKNNMIDYYENHDYNKDVEKKKQTNNDRYGSDYYQQSESYINSKDEIVEKYKNTITKKLLNKYDDLIYTDNKKYIFMCKNGHKYEIDRTLLKNRIVSNTIICTVCNPIDKHISGKELELINFIKDNYNGEIITSDRSLIKPLELDIYLPELKLAFEFNGLYWHSEINKANDYHLIKTNSCDKQGVQLIHVWEDNWNYKQEIIKSMILNKIGVTHNKIYGRKTEIREVNDNKLIRKFLDENHLQGFVGSKIKIGLYYDDELVSLMTFGKKRKFMNMESKTGEYELLRFCNKLNINVIGGASKLFNYFIKNYDYCNLTTYADRSHSNGNLYKTLGFDFVCKTTPNYFYIIDNIRKYRFNFRKDILVKEGYDKDKTEHEIMLERKIYRIYNSGNMKYVKKSLK